MTALDRFARWLAEVEATDDTEIIAHVRALDEALVGPITTFLEENAEHFDDTELIDLVRRHMPAGEGESAVRVFVNSNAKMSRGKMAAHVAHAVLTAAGVHPDTPIIVLGAKPRDIETMSTVIRDAGKTELEPGTLTAGTDWSPELKETKLAEDANVDTSELAMPALLEMAGFVADNPTAMSPSVVAQTIRELITRLETHSP